MTTRCSSSMRLSMLSLLGRWAVKASCPKQSDARHIILPYCSSCTSTTILVRFSQAVDCRPMLTAMCCDGRSVVGPERFNLLPGAAHVLRQTSSHFRELTSAGTPVTKATAVDRTPLSGHPPRSPGVPPAHSERRSPSHRPMALKIRAGAELLTLTPQRSFAASKPRYAMTSGSGALSSRAA